MYIHIYMYIYIQVYNHGHIGSTNSTSSGTWKPESERHIGEQKEEEQAAEEE
jgi:hypothetical protein